MREYSVPVLVDVPSSATCADTVFRRAEEEPGKVVMRRMSGGDWPAVTAADFRDDVAGVAKGMIAAGIEPGDRVALISRTRYEWTVVDYAIWAIGAVSVPIYETSSAEQIRWIISDSGAKAVFVELDEHLATLDSVRGELPGLKTVWRMDDLGALSAEGAGISDETLTARRAAMVSADLATIIYTSGTTGRPKGCRLTHDNLLFTAINVAKGPLELLFAGGGKSALLFLPLAHVFARLIQIVFVETGAVLGHTPNMKNVGPDLVSFKPTFLLGVPRVFEKVYNSAEQKALSEGKGKIFAIAAETAVAYSKAGARAGLGLRLRHALFDKLVYSKLRAATGGALTAAVSGGGALGERLGHFFTGVGIPVLEGYGLTETSAPISVNGPGMNKIGTVGKPIPGCAVRIGEHGEILAKGRNIFDGYWGNEQATADAFDAEGWFDTGDLGTLDADGYVTITGRKKEIIITAAGKNVAPGPLEDAIRSHPLVSQAMVVGEKRPFVAALITLDPEALEHWQASSAITGPADPSTDPRILVEIQQAVDKANSLVSKAEQIKKFVILGTDLTEESGHLTPTLKIKRNIVLRDYADVIDDLYAK